MQLHCWNLLLLLFCRRSKKGPTPCGTVLGKCQGRNGPSKAIRLASYQESICKPAKICYVRKVPWCNNEGGCCKYPGCCGDCILVLRWRNHWEKKSDWLQCLICTELALCGKKLVNNINSVLLWQCHFLFCPTNKFDLQHLPITYLLRAKFPSGSLGWSDTPMGLINRGTSTRGAPPKY